MTANDIGGPLPPASSKFNDRASVSGRYAVWLQCVMTRIHKRLVVVRFRRMRPRCHQAHRDQLLDGDRNRKRSMDFHASDFGNLPVFFEGIEYFEHLVELL